MPRLLPLRFLAALPLVLLVAATARSETDPAAPAAEEIEFFEKSVRPVLVQHCFECHGDKRQRGGLRLDSREFAIKGTDNGPAVVPEKPDESPLIQAIRYDGELKMPPQGKLPDEAVAALTEWVRRGAVWPTSKPGAGSSGEAIRWQDHWAFQPLQHAEPPMVDDATWPQSALDRFVLARLEGAGLKPSPPASRQTLLRRVTLDLTGLPPTLAEAQAFAADESPDAFARVVDRLLESPRYGERWGRYWLDLARYADTKGYVFTEDRNYPTAYMYRDWVINAFNQDLPYDQFLIQQIAADQLPTASDPETLSAMGFFTLGRRFLNHKPDIIDDRIDVLTRGMLGLTVACARCHDHKFDPIPTADYYSLYGVFDSSDEPKNDPNPLRLVDVANPHNVRVFVRGNPHNHGPEAPRQFLSVIAGENRKPFQNGSGRLELAQAIASRDNPLTARVLVNRVWGYHFGAGLVRTPSDFGVRSEPPSHPELLDLLALEFMEEGWSIKKLHRKILLSQTWQQASDDRPEAAAIDPENRLWWRMNRRRLDFEGLRDSLLAASGKLDLTAGGASVDITAEPFTGRRTIYGFIDRQNLPGLFRTFDFASPDTHSPQRFTTTIPQQALFLMNSPFLTEQAEALAVQPEMMALADPQARVAAMYQRIFARAPDAAELQLGVQFISNSTEHEPPAATLADAWQYGYGGFDPEQQRTKNFQPFAKWVKLAWQGGEQLPDPEIGWSMLHAQGGHPGNDLEHAAIRRWTAPQSGEITIRGRLRHRQNEGDGVRGRIISSTQGLLGEWSVREGNDETRVATRPVQQGETIDFAADCLTNPNHDSFSWSVTVNFEAGNGEKQTFDSTRNFSGPRGSSRVFGSWERYAQALLMSNEFVFVD